MVSCRFSQQNQSIVMCFFADSLTNTGEVRGVISHRYLYRAYAENGADGGETSMTQEISAVTWTYPLVMSKKTMENHHF